MERCVDLPHGTTLCIEERGDPGDPLLLQLEGHMAQLVATPTSYCDRLAAQEFRVVRVDNRDVGRSSSFPGRRYVLDDMVEDVHELIGALGGPAVVCGRSMGGAIAQLLALTHPDDVRGLGLFFTFAKEPGDILPSTAVTPAPFTDRASFLAWEQAALPGIAGPDHPFTTAAIADLAATMWDRGVTWEGFERQRFAMADQTPWAHRLGQISVPTVVVHGEDDPVVPVSAGRRLAELIPGADLVTVPGLGHQQPPELDDLFVSATLTAAGR